MPIRVRLPRFAVPALLTAVLVLAVGAPIVTAADRSVRIADFAFAPRTLTITVGDRVTWTNRDAVEHTATARNGSFDTGLLGDGESATFRFTSAGTYRYLCTPHPSMTGTIVVRAAGSAVPPPTDTEATVVVDPAARADGPTPLTVIVGALLILGLGTFVWPRRSARSD